MKLTKQEKINQRNLLINCLFFLASLLMLASNNFLVNLFGYIICVMCWITIAEIGYSEGWELKRISMIEEE